MEFDKRELRKYQKPLSRLSHDKENGRVVCDFSNGFIDFDELKKVRRSQKLPMSPDMLFWCNRRREVWFVEFKSSSEQSLEKEKFALKRKLLDGLIQFYEIFQDFYEYKKFYFVVFPRTSSPEEEVMNALQYEKSILFDLEEVKGKFVEDVVTDHCDAMVREWEKRFGIRLCK